MRWEQFKQLVESSQWLDTAIKPTNRDLAEEGLKEFFETAGFAAPKRIIWCGSPLGLVLTVNLLKEMTAGMKTLQWRREMHYSCIEVENDTLGASLFNGIISGPSSIISKSIRKTLAKVLGDSYLEQLFKIHTEECTNLAKSCLKEGQPDDIASQVGVSLTKALSTVLTGEEDPDFDLLVGKKWSVNPVVPYFLKDSYSFKHFANCLSENGPPWLSNVGTESEDSFNYWGESSMHFSSYNHDHIEPNEGYLKLLEGCGAFYIAEKMAFLTERPIRLSVKGERRSLHNLDGPAIVWPDGSCLYCVEGTSVTREFIEGLGNSTLNDIWKEHNVEMRSAMISKANWEKIIANNNVKLIHQDDYGKLWDATKPSRSLADEVINFIEVVNSTPESDGSFKNYFLRVPPGMKTAKEAVAWTFGKQTNEYDPEFES
jgi:hypothetical protein